MLAGKMKVVYGISTSGGYRYFHSPSPVSCSDTLDGSLLRRQMAVQLVLRAFNLPRRDGCFPPASRLLYNESARSEPRHTPRRIKLSCGFRVALLQGDHLGLVAKGRSATR